MAWGYDDPPMFGNQEAREQWMRENPEEAARIDREIAAYLAKVQRERCDHTTNEKET